VQLFGKEAKNLAYSSRQVLFNFMGDPYNPDEPKHEITKQCLEIALTYKLPVAILTKGGERCLRDIPLFKKFRDHIQVGATLTFFDEQKSKEWESGAASPKERVETLKALHENGIKTWASFEPVIEPDESMMLIKTTLPFVDVYKVGKLNNFQGLDKLINWTAFLEDVVKTLRESNKPFYVKHDLRLAAPSVKLFGNEVLPDEFCSPSWIHDEELF
jgi:hypothetical protein